MKSIQHYPSPHYKSHNHWFNPVCHSPIQKTIIIQQYIFYTKLENPLYSAFSKGLYSVFVFIIP